MKMSLYEYNVTPNIENRNILLINVENDKVVYKDVTIEDNDLIYELKEFIAKNRESLLKYNEIEHSNFKGGRQRILTLNIDDTEIKLIGNTDNNDIADFYNNFKEELINIIDKYI